MPQPAPPDRCPTVRRGFRLTAGRPACEARAMDLYTRIAADVDHETRPLLRSRLATLARQWHESVLARRERLPGWQQTPDPRRLIDRMDAVEAGLREAAVVYAGRKGFTAADAFRAEVTRVR